MSKVATLSLFRDPTAFFLEFYPTLYSFVSSATGATRADVEDLAQETLFQAWRDRDRFRKESEPLTWILAIAKHRVYDFLRKRRRESMSLNRALERLETEAIPDPVLQCAELGARVRTALQELPEEFVAVLLLRYFQEKSLREIAEELGESEDAVESRLRRARMALRDRLREELP